jgi:molybdenum cofactor biosynthesis enzyme MoaA
MRLSLTDKCNLRCTYCMPAGRPGSEPVPDPTTPEPSPVEPIPPRGWGMPS